MGTELDSPEEKQKINEETYKREKRGKGMFLSLGLSKG